MKDDIISQNELDALLSTVIQDTEKSEEEDSIASHILNDDGTQKDHTLGVYDFLRRPGRFSKNQLQMLQDLYGIYARNFSTTLTSYLREFVEIEVASIDQLVYSEFVMSISNPSCVHLFCMDPVKETAIFEMNLPFVYFIVDTLFGGFGKVSEHKRELTPIEQNIARNIVSRGLEELSSVWEHFGKFTPKITGYETNPFFVQIVPPDETVLLITFEVHLSKLSGVMSLCFPCSVIEQMFGNFSEDRLVVMPAQTTAGTRALMEQEMQDVDVPLSVLIGQTKVTLRDLLQLEEGDVLCLEKHLDDNLIVQIGGKSKMEGKSGLVGRKKAVRITTILESKIPVLDELEQNSGRGEENE